MRILVCGVTSDLGRAFARAALGAGHEVIGVSAAPHRYLPPAVALTTGDAATAAALVPNADVVVHLSPVEREVPESGGIPALRTLATAAARHGVRFVVPLAHGPDAGDADRVVRDAGGEHVVIRTAPLGGRLLDWQACRTIATLLSAPRDTQWRFVHTDDLIRFLLVAIADSRTGVVSLIADGVVFAGQARDALRGVAVRGIPQWPEMSTSDKKNSAREWGFECGWTTAEIVDDLARGARGRKLGADGATEVLARLPLPTETLPRRRPPEDDGTVLTSVALPSMAVESDDRIDPRFPVYSARSTAELFPGPLTPLSIDLHTTGLRAANQALGRLMGLEGELADEWEGRGHAVFGHHVYAGVSVAVATAALLPGWSGQTVSDRAFGDDRAEIDLFPLDHPSLPTGLRRLAAKLAALSRFIGVVRRYRAAARDFAATAVAEHEADVTTLSDAALVARALLLRDRLSQGWVHSQVGDLFAHVTTGPLRRRAKNGPAALNRGGDVTSEHAFVAVGALAELLAADDELRALAGWGDLDAVRSNHPEFAAAFDETLTRLGHRGPGEAELSNETFARRAAQLLAAAVNTAVKPEPVSEPDEEPEPVLTDETDETDETEKAAEETPEEEPEKPAEGAPVEAPVKVKRGVADRLAIAGQRSRELARDATMRYTDELRRLVREWGRRQLDAGRLAAVDDVYFLTFDELLTLPADAPDRIRRRREDHERLRDVRMPAVVNGSWRPEAAHDLLPSGKQLTGIGVAEGVVEGRVRVVSPQAEAALEPGEILVTHVADVGHTALFGYAAAVVTDLGEPMSRAAILARERGIPCVANTRDASVRLGDGAFVRVDGVAGTVAVLEPAPVFATELFTDA